MPVQAHPGARFNGVTGSHDARLKVAVTQAPEKGKANKQLVIVLAAALGVKRSQVTLQSGEVAARKVFLISDITTEDLRRRLEAVLSE